MTLRPRPSRALLWFALTLLLMLTVSPLWAQTTPALTKSFEIEIDDGLTLAFSYPKGWVTETTDFGVYLASSADALEQLKSGDITEPEGVGMSIFFPSLLDQLDLPRTTPPEETLTAFLETAELEGDIQMLTGTTIPVAAGMVTLVDDPDDGGFVAALGFPDGTVIAAVQPGEMVDATVLAILDTIALTNGDGSEAPNTDTGNDITSGDAETVVLTIQQPNGRFELSFTVPEGWFYEYAEDNDTVYFGSTPSALEQASSAEAEFDQGEVAISLGLPAIVEQIGASTSADPDEAIQAFLDLTNSSGIILEDPSFTVPAAFSSVAGNNEAASGEIFALAFNPGTLIIAIQPPGSVDDTVIELLQSIRFGEPGAPIATAELIRQWASSADGSSQYGATSWSFEQATGEPDTEACQDSITAWASQGSDTREILIVEFDQAVIPTQINIHQTYNPGAIVMIDVGNTDDRDRVLPLEDSADPPGNTDCPGIFSLDVSGVDVPIDFVVIYLDQSLTGSWNEIDAVELVGIPAE